MSSLRIDIQAVMAIGISAWESIPRLLSPQTC